MPVDLSDYVGSLQRAVTPVGVDPANVTPATWTSYLTDAFWEARLDGFMKDYAADEDGIIAPLSTTGPDMSRQWVSLIVSYAAMQILTNNILAMKISFRAKAGPVEFEQQSSANAMTEMLKLLRATRDRLLLELSGNNVTDVHLVDAYCVRSFRQVFGQSPNDLIPYDSSYPSMVL